MSTTPSLADEIERRWNSLRAKNPNYFDGRLYHVLGVHRNGHGGATLHVMECAYRYHAVQTPDFDLGQRALGVKGVTMLNPSPSPAKGEGRGEGVPPPSQGMGKGVAEPHILPAFRSTDPLATSPAPSSPTSPIYLLGLRSPHVAAYQNLWEFAPAGGVEPGKDPAAIVRQELLEETGYEPAGDPIPIAVMFDDVLNCWEIVYRMTLTASATDPAPTPHTREYSQLAWHTLDDLPSPLSPIAQQIAIMLRQRGSQS